VHDSYISAPYILTKLKASQEMVQGMSYWTYTDLFEEPGPPTAPFQGGFGLLNPQGIRKPAFFAYKYLHALQGDSLKTSDPQAMLATQGGNVTAVIWDLEQPDQKVSNRSFYTKPIPASAAAPVQLRVTHLVPNAAYRLEVHRVGYHANDAYSAYIEMGSPKELTAAQIAHLNELTRDLPETDKVVRSGPTGTVEFTVPMNSNDVVLVKLKRSQGATERSRIRPVAYKKVYEQNHRSSEPPEERWHVSQEVRATSCPHGHIEHCVCGSERSCAPKLAWSWAALCGDLLSAHRSHT